MIDITAIYLTLNRMPPAWVEFHMDTLKEAVAGIPVISISRLPMEFGTNHIQDSPPSYTNYYRQLLRGAKLSRTKYIAVVEDDTLYHSSHFMGFRPKDDEFAYNMHRWSVFTWGERLYSLRRRLGNFACIAPRDLLIEALEERFAKWGPNPPEHLMGECGRWRVERRLGVTERKHTEFYSKVPLVNLSHPSGTGDREKRSRKGHSRVRAFDIPHWGRPEDIVKHFAGAGVTV